MDLAFSPEQKSMRDDLAAFLARECTPEKVRATLATPRGRSTQRWRGLASLGVVGLMVPQEFGGQGRDETWLALLLEEAGRAALPEALGAVIVASALLADAGSDDELEAWLPRVAAGDAIVVASLPARPLVDDADVADLVLVSDRTDVHAFPADAVQKVAQPSLDGSRRQFTVAAKLTARSCLAVRAGDAIAAAALRSDLSEAAILVGAAGKLAQIGGAGADAAMAGALAQAHSARTALHGAAGAVAGRDADRAARVATALNQAARAAHLAAQTALQIHCEHGGTDQDDVHLWLQRALAARPPR